MSHWYFANVFSEDEYRYSYLIKVFNTGEGNSTVIAPFPVFESDNEFWQNETFDNLDLEHFSGEVELVYTEYGIGLRMDFVWGGTIFTHMEKEIPAFSLSFNQTINGKNYHQFYFEPEQNESVDIHFSTSHGHAWKYGGDYIFNTTAIMFSDIFSNNYEYRYPLNIGWNNYRVYILHDYGFYPVT